MKFTFLRAGRALLTVLAVSTLGVACSKNEATTEAAGASPTPTETETPSTSATATPTPRPTISPSATPLAAASPFGDIDVRMRDLERRMNSVFSNAFRNVGNWLEDSTLASSVDLREQNDKYVARVFVPHAETSKVDAKIENGALHITAQTERSVNGNTTKENYEQVITLAKPVEADKMKIDRKQDMIVISIPKTTASAPEVATASPSPATSPWTASTDWGEVMSNQFAAMRRQMNQAFHDVFANETLSGASALQLGSAVNVDDQKDKYVVHFYLPDHDLSNVNVDFKNGQLDLTAKEQENAVDKSTNGTQESTTTGQYEEMVTLAGPVKDKDMKVERKADSVIVTLPKA